MQDRVRFVRGAVCTALSTAAFFGLAGEARAQVTIYTVGKAASYEQVADDAQPVTAYAWAFSTEMQTVNDSDAATGRAIFDSPRSPFLIPKIPGFPIYREFGGYFDTQALLDADFPDGLYTFEVSGGSLGVQQGTLTIDSALFPNSVPYFTGDTYSRLHSLDPFADFNGTISTFDGPPGATTAESAVQIYRRSGVGATFTQILGPGESAFSMAAGTLRPGRPYIVVVSHATFRTLSGDFPGGLSTSSAVYSRGTTFTIDVGCPGDFNQDGQVDFFDYLDFVAAFAADDLESDFNDDGQVDFFDYLDFVAAFARDCPN